MEPTEPTIYDVAYRLHADTWPDRLMARTVIITPGYTVLADVPKIIGLLYGLKPTNVEVVSITNPRPLGGR